MKFNLQTFAVWMLAIGAGPSVATTAASAEYRALVIGIDSYPNLDAQDQLKKAVNDATSVAALLEQSLGYKVKLGVNLNEKAMTNHFRGFASDVQEGDVALLYYAGHGISVSSKNLLLPSDIEETNADEPDRLIGDAFDLAKEIERIRERKPKAVVAIVDACRDNPFGGGLSRSMGNEAGLSEAKASKGVFILYSAGVGQAALDRLTDKDPNPNSVFTRVLLQHLSNTALDHIQLAKQVQTDVEKLANTIGEEQFPAYYDQMKGYLKLKGDSSDEDLAELTADEAATGTAEEKARALLLQKRPIKSHQKIMGNGGSSELAALANEAPATEAQATTSRLVVRDESVEDVIVTEPSGPRIDRTAKAAQTPQSKSILDEIGEFFAADAEPTADVEVLPERALIPQATSGVNAHGRKIFYDRIVGDQEVLGSELAPAPEQQQ